MNLRVSGKHMEIGDAFRSRIEQRISEAVGKYFDGGYSGSVTVEKTRAGFNADCRVALDTGMTFHTSGSAFEPVVAFETAAERLDKRLRRYNRRLRDHSAEQRVPATDINYRVVAGFDEEADEEVPADYAPTIVAETTLPLATMTVASAVIELDTKDSPVYVFRNAGNGQINLVYRRPDGNIGWIDPSEVDRASADR